MIVQGEDIVDYLLTTSGWEKKYYKPTIKKLINWKQKRGLRGLSPIEHMFLEHQLGGYSITSLEKETNIRKGLIIKIFEDYGLPKLTRLEGIKKKWADPEFKDKHVEGLKKKNKDDMFKEKQAEATKKIWEDKEFKERYVRAVKKAWENGAYKDRQSKKEQKVI